MKCNIKLNVYKIQKCKYLKYNYMCICLLCLFVFNLAVSTITIITATKYLMILIKILFCKTTKACVKQKLTFFQQQKSNSLCLSQQRLCLVSLKKKTQSLYTLYINPYKAAFI